ncbi:MAG: glycosyltransferase [bacterium]|nr:glycosyltransferase [bacterium]
MEVIYRGIDFPQLTKKKKKADQIFIGFVGRLVKLKGVALLISAFSELIKEIPELRLKIVGDGPEKESLQKQVQELNLQDKVSFFGFQEQEKVHNELLPKFDLFVNPSFQEGLPTTVIEALLAENIVVATEV